MSSLPRTGAADLLAARARRDGRPVSATIQVTDRCNYACVHCYQTHDEHPDELSFDELVRVLDEIAAAGVLFLTLMGGEFFMRPDADAILEAAHARGFALRLFTTGHHIHEARAARLAELRPLQVELSLYSANHRRHEAVTQQPGSWERTVAAARRLIAHRVPVVLKAPVMEVNVAAIEELGRFAAELGAEWSFDPKITPVENGVQDPVSLRLREGSLRDFYRGPMSEHLAKTYGPGTPAAEAITVGPDALRPLHHTPCRAGQQSFSITPTGDVQPCSALPISCGSLREQSFEEIWRGSAVLEDVRDLRWAAIQECNACALRTYCQRCHGTALTEHGEMRGPSLEACRHAVAVRDSLRDRGLIPDTETALPPTWGRVDADGQHAARARDPRRPVALRVLA